MSTPAQSVPPEPEHRPRPGQRLKRFLLGGPKDLQDPHLFRHISLIAFLAWVGLGADGLSSSAYGPEEAFKNLGEHTYLAVLLAAEAAHRASRGARPRAAQPARREGIGDGADADLPRVPAHARRDHRHRHRAAPRPGAGSGAGSVHWAVARDVDARSGRPSPAL